MRACAAHAGLAVGFLHACMLVLYPSPSFVTMTPMICMRPQPQGANAFDAKIDKTSSDMYFHYYGMLQHQQNMLQVR